MVCCKKLTGWRTIYKYAPLYANSLLWKTYVSACCHYQSHLKRIFTLGVKKEKCNQHSVFVLQPPLVETGAPKKRVWCLQCPLLGTKLSLKPQDFALYLWAPGLYLSLFCASANKICPKVIALCLQPFRLTNGFIRTLCFQIVGETCYAVWLLMNIICSNTFCEWKFKVQELETRNIYSQSYSFL